MSLSRAPVVRTLAAWLMVLVVLHPGFRPTLIDSTSTLLTIAEIAATFAGFSALISLLSQRGQSPSALHDVLRLRMVIAMSILVVAGALVPVALLSMQVEAAYTWWFASLVYLLLDGSGVATFFRSFLRVRDRFPPDIPAFIAVAVMQSITICALLVVLTGLFPAYHFGLYVVTLSLTLSQAALVFTRLIGSTFRAD